MKKCFWKTYQIISEHITKDACGSAKLFDAATGTGTLAIQLSNCIGNITAIDLSPEMVRIAKEKSSRYQIGTRATRTKKGIDG